MATLHRNSKADTRFFSDRAAGGAANLATDISQYRTNLTNNTTYLTSLDARLAVRSPREIACVVKLATGNSGILLNWGNTAGTVYIYRITISGGTPQFGHNNALLTFLAPPNISATARLYAIHWSTDYDFNASTYFSEFAICDLATGTWAVSRIAHTQPQAPVAAEQLNLIGRGAGSSPFTGGIAVVDYLRIGCRWHSTTEASEDWGSESAAPTITGIQPNVELAPSSPSFFSQDPNEDVADVLLDEGTFGGPIEFAAVINAGASTKRLFSPILNVTPNDPVTHDNTYVPTNFYRILPFSLIRLGAQYLFTRPLPYLATKARVRVFAQTWLAAGAPGGSVVSIQMAMFAMGSITETDVGLPAFVTSTTNHTSAGAGQWFDLGVLDIPSNALYFALGHKFGSGTGASYLRLKIKAIVVEPYEET